MKQKGAQVVQINHPRGGAGFLQFFDVIGLNFDLVARAVVEDAPIPRSHLRLPDRSLWDTGFNALEVWNSITVRDSNGDGVRDDMNLDVVMRDWFNFLSLGIPMAPMANSDTHNAAKMPMGVPRTLVRVDFDDSQAIEDGMIVGDILTRLSGSRPIDVVLTSAPHIRVSVPAVSPQSVLGRVVDGTAGSVTFSVEVQSPLWAPFDTIEVFTNQTPEVGLSPDLDDVALRPLLCLTSRPLASLDPLDVCNEAPIAPAPLVVTQVPVGVSGRWQSSTTIAVAKTDLPIVANTVSEDAWFVFRVRGSRGLFPQSMEYILTSSNIATFVSGSDSDREALLDVEGPTATAVTSAVFVDFDGGGYRAIFAP